MFYLVIIFVLCVTATLLDTSMSKSDLKHSTLDQRILNIATICMLIYYAGFRNIGGTDFATYGMIYDNSPGLLDFFKHYKEIDELYYVFGADRGYIFVNSFMKTIGFTYFGYNLCHSLFCIMTIYWCTRKYTDNFSIVIMVILYKMFFYDFCISLRQTITIAIFFYMLNEIENKRAVRYYLLCFLCYWIHAAASVLFVVYFIKDIKLSKNTILIWNAIFLPTLLLSALNIPVLKVFEGMLEWDIFTTDVVADKAARLIGEQAASAINWLHTAEYFLIMLLLILTFDDIQKEYPQSDTMIKLFLCLLPIFTLFRNYEILTRWKDYFTISYGFILSWLAGIKDGNYRRWVVVCVCLWVGFGYFRFINLFDGGVYKYYYPIRGLVELYVRPF